MGLPDLALDLSDPDAGNVDASVVGDGKVLWERKGVTLKGGPQQLGPLKIEGVAVLELVVDFGKNGANVDLASWVNPILVRK